jgi:hypothetical protein
MIGDGGLVRVERWIVDCVTMARVRVIALRADKDSVAA